MKRLSLNKRLESKKNQYREVLLSNIKISEEELNDIFIDLIHKEENLEAMFMQEINNEEERLGYISHFIPDDVRDKTSNQIEDFIKTASEANATFFSELAEGLVALLAQRFLNAMPTHALMSDVATLIDTHSGVDGVLYDEENENLFFVEAKFFTDLSSGKSAVINSLTVNAKNKYESFQRHSKKQLSLIHNKKSYEIRTIDALTIPISFIGFVLHGEKNNIQESEFAERIEVYVNETFELDDLNYKFILFHLDINDKQKIIFEIINRSLKVIEEA